MYAALAKAVLELFGSLLNFAAQRSQLNNTPEIKARAVAQTEIDANSAVEKALAKNDLKTLREAIAE